MEDGVVGVVVHGGRQGGRDGERENDETRDQKRLEDTSLKEHPKKGGMTEMGCCQIRDQGSLISVWDWE